MDVSEFDFEYLSLSESRFVFNTTVEYPILTIYEKNSIRLNP
jgi:hypothetical protein